MHRQIIQNSSLVNISLIHPFRDTGRIHTDQIHRTKTSKPRTKFKSSSPRSSSPSSPPFTSSANLIDFFFFFFFFPNSREAPTSTSSSSSGACSSGSSDTAIVQQTNQRMHQLPSRIAQGRQLSDATAHRHLHPRIATPTTE